MICHPFLSALRTVRAVLLYFFFFFFLGVLNGSMLPHDCHVTESHVIVTSPVK